MNKPAIISCSVGYSQLRNSKEDKILLRDLLYHLFFLFFWLCIIDMVLKLQVIL